MSLTIKITRGDPTGVWYSVDADKDGEFFYAIGTLCKGIVELNCDYESLANAECTIALAKEVFEFAGEAVAELRRRHFTVEWDGTFPTIFDEEVYRAMYQGRYGHGPKEG